ncbi:MAG TPA: hypothetical protein VK745_03125 [Polyangiaceae bacterium]|jgi:uncharacterized membrane protein|nr:hypothetical protein [Polyangiaceae bacterium]
MPKYSRFLWLAALALGCAPKADKACPTDAPAECLDAAALSYNDNIGAIMNARCTPCHATGGVEASIILTDYGHVTGERMTIEAQLLTCAMPPDGSPQLTTDERTQILSWLSCGAPQ